MNRGMSARRPWAWPLVPVYGAALAAQDALRTAGLPRERRLCWPVISIGSVSAGGAGKTPLVIALANLLSGRGWTVDVLSRGYRRAGRGVERVELLTSDPARRYGDEPTLIAQRTGVPVWVGSSRFAAGSAAEQQARLEADLEADKDATLPPDSRSHGEQESLFSADGQPRAGSGERKAHLLDDGLQHRALARSFDLVLVTAADLRDTLLPAGNLREPLSALRRSDALAVREEELAVVEPQIRAGIAIDIPIWTVRRSLRFPAPLGIFGAGLRPLAFCALARPEGFAAMLAKAGCGVVDTVIFPDHHRYDGSDVAELLTLAKRLSATGLVTTEKDAVKLSPALLARLETEVGPVIAVALDTAFVYESPVVRLLEQRLRSSPSESEVVDPVRSR